MIGYEKYLSIPYKKYGREKTGCDCWGLICLILEREVSITLPSMPDSQSDMRSLYECAWKKIDTPEAHCIGLSIMDDGEKHAVLFLDSKRFIEMCHDGVFVRPLEFYDFKCFYRVANV